MTRAVLAVLMVGSAAGFGQTAGGATSTAHSTGTCSPAISGSNNNQITISCTAVSRDKANEIIRLMNRILKEQIDPELVYKRLGELQGEVGRIDQSVNPLGHVSPAKAKLVWDGEPLLLRCGDKMNAWAKANEEATHASMESALAAKRAQMEAARAAAQRGERTQRSADLTPSGLREAAIESIAPQQASLFEEGAGVATRRWIDEVRKVEPDLSTLPFPTVAQHYDDAQAMCGAGARLYTAFYRALRDEAQGQQ